MKAKRRIIARGEALALAPDALRVGRDAMWWDFYTSVPENERCGSVSVVHIRGALDHHRGYGCDSYDAIRKRVTDAFTGQDAHRQAMLEQSSAKWRARWAEADGEEPPEIPDVPASPVPPSCVVLRIDSPGGVVSGLNETVYWLRRESANRGIPLVAYIDELGASAAYALACGCDEIVLPSSAIAGSVGVISTLYDQVEADKKMGIKVVTLTSGARKSDGHPHVPISQGALDAEQRRVDQMATAFFKIVSRARGLSVDKVRSYQAGIYMGRDAVARGLADDVMGWDKLLATLEEATSGTLPGGSSKKPLATKSRNESGSTGTRSATVGTSEKPMSLATMTNLIKRTKAALKAETDPKKRKALALAVAAHEASLEAMKKTKIKYEETSEEEEESEEEEAAEEEESGNETDRKEADADDDGDDDGDKKDDGDEDEEEDEEEEEEESSKKAASAILALAEEATGRKGKRAIGALASIIAEGKRASERVAKIEKEHRAERKEASISAALSARKITPHEARQLRSKSATYVKEFIGMRKGAVVNADDETVHVPTGAPPKPGEEEASLPEHVRKSIDSAVLHSAGAGVDTKALRAELVKAHLAEHQTRMRAGLNGAGRY